jgi:hypothetical protein
MVFLHLKFMLFQTFRNLLVNRTRRGHNLICYWDSINEEAPVALHSELLRRQTEVVRNLFRRFDAPERGLELPSEPFHHFDH